MTALLLLTLSAIGIDPDSAAAFADRAKLPDPGHYVYATVSNQRSQQAKDRLAGQLAFVCASLSSKSYLGDQLPRHVAGSDVYRLDLQGLGWLNTWVGVIQERYPYRPDVTKPSYPLVVRADWIVAELTDPIQTGNAQYLLLYGKELKTGAEFRKFWSVSQERGDEFGFMEGRSGVQAKGAQRLMVNRATGKRASFFETMDSKRVAGKTSPSENLLPGTLKHDGQELLVGIPKHYAGEGGQLLACFLNNGNTNPDKAQHDKRVDAAPVDLVKDDHGLRGFDIRNTMDCLACHTKGMQDPTINEYKAIILGGHKIYADKISKQEIERFYESPFMQQIRRFDEDYATAIRLCNGLTPERNAANFTATIREYDADLTLAQAAREVYYSADDLRFAIANYSPSGKLTEALAGLAHGKMVTRDEWVENQKLLQLVILPLWRQQK